MRWAFGRREQECSGCGALAAAGAVWCGGCGAALAQGPSTGHDDEQVLDAPLAPAPTPSVDDGRSRLWFAAGVVAMLGVAVALNATRYAPGTPVLGAADVPTGTSSTGPPPEGLRLAWGHEFLGLRGVDQGFTELGRPDIVVADGRARVDGVVVDLADGRVVATGARSGGRYATELVGDDLVSVDTISGEVARTVPLPDAVTDGLQAYVELQVGDRTVLVRPTEGPEDMFSGGGEAVVVGADGTVEGIHSGVLTTWLDHVGPGASALPLRNGDVPERTPVEVRDIATGEVVHRSRAGWTTAVSAADGVTAIAATQGDLGAPGTGIEWLVTVLHGTGSSPVVSETRLVAASPPRLLGRWAERVLVGSVSGRELTVLAIDADGSPTEVATSAVRARMGGGIDLYEDSVLQSAAVDEDRLVLVDVERETVTAVGGDGRTMWTVDVPGAGTVGAVDDVVAVGTVRGGERWLLSGEDGSTIARVSAPQFEDDEMAAVVAIDRAIGFSPGAGGPSMLGFGGMPPLAAVWLDAASGNVVQFGDVAGELEGELPPDGTMLHGTIQSTDGDRRPVLTQHGDVLRLLVPGEGFVDLDVPPRAQSDGGFGGFDAVVGIVERHLVVSREEQPTVLGSTEPEHPVGTVFSIDLDDRGVTTIEDSFAVGVGGGMLLVAPSDTVWVDDAPQMAAVDPESGAERWRSPWEGWPSIVSAADTFVTLEGLQLVARDLGDGTERWRVRRDRLTAGGAVLTSRYVVEREFGTTVVARLLETGEVVWRTDLGSVATTMTAAGDHVVVGTRDGAVVHLDAEGAQVQRIEVGAAPIESIAVIGETVVVTADGHAYGLRRDGTGITARDEVDLP